MRPSAPPPRPPTRILGPGRANSHAGRAAQARRGPCHSSTPNAALPRLDSRTATGRSTARTADPLPQDRADLLDWPGAHRRQEPPSATHDGGHRASNFEAHPGENWRLRTTPPGSRHLESPFCNRAKASAGGPDSPRKCHWGGDIRRKTRHPPDGATGIIIWLAICQAGRTIQFKDEEDEAAPGAQSRPPK